MEPERHLVMHGDTREAPAGALALRAGDFANVVWALHLRPNGDGSTRLIERWRADFNPSLLNRPFYRLFLEPGAFLMQRKMLLGIKERAERLHREAGATSGAGAAAWTAAGPAGRRE